MFMLPRNPFDEWPKWWTMTDGFLGDTRVAGTMEPLYWSPASPIFELTPTEARKLPQRVVWFGCTQHIPREVLGFIKPECRDQPFLLQSNFEVSAELKELLARVVAATREGSLSDAWSIDGISRLLTLQDECLKAFATCAAESRRRAKEE